eukprot:4443753-Heterocapsa_arctica.AAC.1
MVPSLSPRPTNSYAHPELFTSDFKPCPTRPRRRADQAGAKEWPAQLARHPGRHLKRWPAGD